MRKKIGGKIGPGSPANMGHMGKSTAKMMKKSPLEIDMEDNKEPISKDKAVRLTEKANKLLDKGFAKKDESGNLTKRGDRQMKRGFVKLAKSYGLKGKDAREDAEAMMQRFR